MSSVGEKGEEAGRAPGKEDALGFVQAHERLEETRTVLVATVGRAGVSAQTGQGLGERGDWQMAEAGT